MKRHVVDASFLVSAIRSCDVHHVACYNYYRNNEDLTWVVPTVAYFEYQAAQSRLRREGRKAYRELYIPDLEVFEISLPMIRRTAELDLFNVFENLRGADLIYACIARLEDIPLITCDGHFDEYASIIRVINPTRRSG